ncbi:hypothetical protein QTI66_32640 [Variovorax sp. J22R133]|uniref:hypothetical protein n=1 Tax=Variovorax brevis TaxID=3053503 RepID=UPI00257736B6|nr:hypothetical protein [Variovorax sp. J22R133]MDM0116876.1 hypothetical protein [Variovorax sp. J22R133]
MTSVAFEDPRWLALSKYRQDKLLEKYRNIEVEHFEWWEHLYEDFKVDCADIGIGVNDIRFSGFWSQGDGASFTGRIDNWRLFLNHVGETDLLLAAMASGDGDWPGWTFKIERRASGHNYCHEHSVDANFDLDPCNVIDAEKDPVRHHAFQQLLERIEYRVLEEQYIEACRALMRELYHDLEEEHDYLTSDDKVVEIILDCYAEELVDPDAEEQEEEATEGFSLVP